MWCQALNWHGNIRFVLKKIATGINYSKHLLPLHTAKLHTVVIVLLRECVKL